MDDEFSIDFDKLKKFGLPLILLLILGFAFVLRVYHIDYPVIGYHNWKETRYITPARNFLNEGFFEYGFFIPAYDFPSPHNDPSGAHADFFPISSILAAVMMSIFGMELWAARLPILLTGVFTVLGVYFMVLALFKRKDLALSASLLTAINPLYIFFSHNVQQIPFGLFFISFGLYFYINWIRYDKNKDLILAAFLIVFGVSTKYTYGIFALPCLAVFPYRRFKDVGKRIKTFLGASIPVILFATWYMYSKYINTVYYGSNAKNLHTSSLLKVFNPSPFFTDSFWQAMKSFAKDNYTIPGLYIAAIGLIIFILFFIKNRKDLGYKFMMWYIAAGALYFLLIPGNIKGHSYHQYPVSFIFVFLMAYATVVAGSNLGALIRSMGFKGSGVEPSAKVLALLILLFFIFNPSMEAVDRQFNTQFPGLDIAGDYIKDHKQPGERLIHSSHQAFGVLWHGEIKGTRGIPSTIEKIYFAEEKLNATWLFIYQWDFPMIVNNDERWQYLSANYSLKQTAFVMNGNQPQPVYFLLYRDGGGFNLTDLNRLIANKPIQKRGYEYTSGPYELQYVNV